MGNKWFAKSLTGNDRSIGLQSPEQTQGRFADPVFASTIADRDGLTADSQADVAVRAKIVSGHVIVGIIRREPSLLDDLDLEVPRPDATS
jgi:hypothetical protein